MIKRADEVKRGDTILASKDRIPGGDYRTVERIVESTDGRSFTFVFAGPDRKSSKATESWGWRKFRRGSRIEVL